jgi:hypothetical protein
MLGFSSPFEILMECERIHFTIFVRGTSAAREISLLNHRQELLLFLVGEPPFDLHTLSAMGAICRFS